MKSLFIVKPDASRSELEDAIQNTFQKAKTILTCAMFAMNFAREEIELDQGTLYHILSAVDDYLDEMAQLFLVLGNEAS